MYKYHIYILNAISFLFYINITFVKSFLAPKEAQSLSASAYLSLKISLILYSEHIYFIFCGLFVLFV